MTITAPVEASVEQTPSALQGIRVVEFGGFAAGPVVGKHMANYGAEVIRVESRTRMDGFRTHYPPYKDNIPGPDRAGIFSYFNDGKRSLTLNLKTPEGVDLARRLIAMSDVVVENFTPGTIARLGLGYEELSKDHPELVMLSTCNQGQYGPRANHPGFGSQLTSLSGFTYLLGYPDGELALLYGPYIDYIAVGYGAIAVLAALSRRNRTGKGTYIDVSQYETGLQFMTPALLDLFVNGRVATRQGNAHPSSVPHGVYPCRGEEVWCALSVADDAEWVRFGEALGSRDWTREPAFATVEERKHNEQRLNEHVTAWTREREREEVLDALRRHDVRCYAVNSMADLFSDPQLQHRQAWRAVQHPVLGEVRVLAPPPLLGSTPPVMHRAAPTLGQDTEYVLRNILGLSLDEIKNLEGKGVLE